MRHIEVQLPRHSEGFRCATSAPRRRRSTLDVPVDTSAGLWSQSTRLTAVTDGGWPQGTVTFLFTDVEGSTDRWRHDEDAMAVAMRNHDDVLTSVVADAGGRLFKHTGDGVVAAFASPSAAVAAARQAQELLELPVRMGLHTGEAEFRDDDYFGTDTEPRGAGHGRRHGGQILLSAATASLWQMSRRSISAPTRSRDSTAGAHPSSRCGSVHRTAGAPRRARQSSGGTRCVHRPARATSPSWPKSSVRIGSSR